MTDEHHEDGGKAQRSRFRDTWDALARIDATVRRHQATPGAVPTAPIPPLPGERAARRLPKQHPAAPDPRGRHPLVGKYATFRRGAIEFHGRIIGVSPDEKRLSVWSLVSHSMTPLDPTKWEISITDAPDEP